MTTQITSFAQLAALRSKLQAMPQVADRVAARAAQAFAAFAREAFASRESLAGAVYPPGVTLHKSGDLLAKALAYAATGASIAASVAAVPYAKYMLKYGYLPRPRALPAKWVDALAKIANEEIGAELARATR